MSYSGKACTCVLAQVAVKAISSSSFIFLRSNLEVEAFSYLSWAVNENVSSVTFSYWFQGCTARCRLKLVKKLNQTGLNDLKKIKLDLIK